jgi:hypothetical protein
MKKGVGSGVGSGSGFGVGSGAGFGFITQSYGSGDPDPDPHQNVPDLQHYSVQQTFSLFFGTFEFLRSHYREQMTILNTHT